MSVRTAEDASEKQSSLKARLRNGLTYLLTYYSFPCPPSRYIPLPLSLFLSCLVGTSRIGSLGGLCQAL